MTRQNKVPGKNFVAFNEVNEIGTTKPKLKFLNNPFSTVNHCVNPDPNLIRNREKNTYTYSILHIEHSHIKEAFIDIHKSISPRCDEPC